MHLVRQVIRGEASHVQESRHRLATNHGFSSPESRLATETGVRLRCRPPAPFWGWRSLSRITNRPLALLVVSSGTPASAPCTDRQLSRRAALASNTPGIDRRDQGVARPLVRATARHPKRLSSYCATTTDAVGGHSARIRPRRRTSRTLSPRHPSSIRVNGLSDSFAARGLELIVFYDDEGEPSQMRATDECHAHDFDKHPRFVRRPTSSSLRP